MRAEVLIPRRSPAFSAQPSLYTYTVPEELASLVAPGQLVSVPFGSRVVPALLWSLDASDDLSMDPVAPAGEHDSADLKPLADVLLAEPLLLPTHRALAEWLADHYVAPLGAVVRLLLPPGLLSGIRVVIALRAGGEPPAQAAPGVLDDEAMVLGLLRTHGRVERAQVEKALGRARAQAALIALLGRGQIAQSVEVAGSMAAVRHDRVLRLVGSADAIEAWCSGARSRLDALPAVPNKRPRWRSAGPDERAAERILRQLALLDVLTRPVRNDEPRGAWRLEELRRLTRATEAAVRELVAAGLVAIDEVTVRHDPLAGRTPPRTEPLPLNKEQAAVLAAISNVGGERAEEGGECRAHVFLLHGITGSGKTEVYLQALAATLAQGRRGIVLVPEIALTPQAVARFAGRFPGRVALLHSGLTDAERVDEWRRIRAGEVDVVVGSRSALFAPVENLGLIVVDEEHEAAYKEEQRAPTYHARDVAVRLGALTGATIVLGSATPSVEAYWLASQGAYQLLELRHRPTHSPPHSSGVGHGEAAPNLPGVTVVDLRAELRGGNTSILSETLHAALHETLERGEQAILFLNRRGMASCVVCRECGHVARCLHCDVSLTFHATERSLICHYCGRRERVPETCPVCWSASIRYFGLGTERVESAVKRLFPAARVLRWDRDTARTRQAHEDLLRAFSERRADVLVGTQMIAKGLDLPSVTLVGVVSADVALFLPDFRSSERAFQLLAQVAGRAGRGTAPGRVLVQTFNPEHFCIQSAARHDYHEFFAAEVAARQQYSYPPFRRFVKCTFAHADRYTAQIEATLLAERLERLIREQGAPQTDLVGPAPAFLERLRGHYRWQLILRSPDPRPLLRALSPADLPAGWSVDLDPANAL
jgi:primosomal protein N' (replication factor Y)